MTDDRQTEANVQRSMASAFCIVGRARRLPGPGIARQPERLPYNGPFDHG